MTFIKKKLIKRKNTGNRADIERFLACQLDQGVKKNIKIDWNVFNLARKDLLQER